MASAGGEDLIGWHVNRGWEQEADFFPASHFGPQYNRPDIIKLVLTTLDEAEAVKRANAARPQAEAVPAKPAEFPPVLTPRPVTATRSRATRSASISRSARRAV
jgi:hypothetical protein